MIAFVPEGRIGVTPRGEDAAVLVPHYGADGGLEGAMEGVTKAESISNDEREIGGLELEVEGFVLEDPVADVLEGG